MTDHEQILKELDRVAEEFSEMTKSFVDVLKRVEALEVAVFGKAGIGGLKPRH